MKTLTSPRSWTFCGNVRDRGHKKTHCRVCGRPTRYAFIVTHGNYEAFVGPECLSKCSVQQESGESEAEAHQRVRNSLSSYKKEARKNRLISIILYIRNQKPNLDLGAALTEARNHHGMSPKHALFIMALAKECSIEFGNDLIRVSLNNKKHQDQYKTLSKLEKIALLGYVGDAQKGVLRKLDSATT